MATSINYFYEYVKFITNKDQSGNTITPEQFNANCNQAQLLAFSEDYETFAITTAQSGGIVSNFLQTFLKTNYVINPTALNQIIPYPPDFQYMSSAGNYYEGTQNDAELVNNVQWRKMFRPNALEYPTLRHPKYQQIGAGIVVAPYNWGVGWLDYFKLPIAPIWNYTEVDDTPVFNPTGSVDFEWDAFSINRIAGIYLQLIGVNLSDENIQKFGQMFTEETKTII